MRGNRRPARPGFSLLELLVVVAIMATLMGLLLPAVQKMREAAGRTKCQNNLKQIGLALHDYHNAKDSLPPGYWTDHLNLLEIEYNSPGWGWAAYLLPYLEEAPLAEKLRWDLSVEDIANAPARIKVVKTFVCPSDLNTGEFMVYSLYNQKLMLAATNSYAACYGFGDMIGEQAASGNGVFYRNSRTRLADILDGTSTTVAIGERAAWFCQAPWIGVITNGTVRTHPSSPTFIAAIEEAPVMALARTAFGPLNDAYSNPYDFYTPHPTAGPFLFADGSVHALRFTLPTRLWKAIGTRNGGETLSTSDF